MGERPRGRGEKNKGNAGKNNTIWIIICLLLRQRLTAGALVCDQLDMCAFNKPGRIAFVHQRASGQNYKAENGAFFAKDC